MYWTKLRLQGLTAVDFPKVGVTSASPFILKGVDGLGPPEVDVSISNTLNEGGVYQGRRPQLKQIIARVGLNPAWADGQTASDLREILYGLLTPGSGDHVSISLVNVSTTVGWVIGWVSKMEINPFAKDPEVQITLDCVDSYFRALTDEIVDLDDLAKDFPSIENVGNGPAGMYWSLTFTDDVTNWTLTDNPEVNKLEFDYAFLTGDKLEFDTTMGSRYCKVTLASDASVHSLLAAMTTDSLWFQLHGGTNDFITSDDSFDWNQVSYLPKFWGV